MNNVDGVSAVSSDQIQLLSVGGVQFGIPKNDIAMIIDWTEPTPLPFAPPSVLGIVSVEGRMFTVLNVLDYLSIPTTETKNIEKIVVLHGDEQLAIVVDSVDGLDDLVGSSEIHGDGAPRSDLLFSPVACGIKRIKVVDVKQLFPIVIQGHERRRRRF
ncbi:MAG: chemotaxis protein CheW [Pyrinomonadaceae bacterium]